LLKNQGGWELSGKDQLLVYAVLTYWAKINTIKNREAVLDTSKEVDL
jgi:hypothetical protein